MKQLNFPIENELHTRARIAAARAGVPLKRWLERLIEDATTEPKTGAPGREGGKLVHVREEAAK